MTMIFRILVHKYCKRLHDKHTLPFLYVNRLTAKRKTTIISIVSVFEIFNNTRKD